MPDQWATPPRSRPLRTAKEKGVFSGFAVFSSAPMFASASLNCSACDFRRRMRATLMLSCISTKGFYIDGRYGTAEGRPRVGIIWLVNNRLTPTSAFG